ADKRTYAALPPNHSPRRLRFRCPDARSNRARSATSRLSGLFVSLWPGRAEELETSRRERTNACRRDRPFQKRHPNRSRKPAPPRIDRHHTRPRHRHFAPSRAPALAQLVFVAASLCRGALRRYRPARYFVTNGGGAIPSTQLASRF